MNQLKQDLQDNKKICFLYPYKTGGCSEFKQSIDDIKGLMENWGMLKNEQVLNYRFIFFYFLTLIAKCVLLIRQYKVNKKNAFSW